MNCKIPFTKDIDFEKKLYEITSISLEHEIKITDDALKGNFIVSGDYKSHEVSINKEPFSYILPFEIALTDDIDHSTIEFMIEDFTYEVIGESILRVNIDFNVVGSKLAKEPEVPDELFEDASNLFREPDALEEIPDLKKTTEPSSNDTPNLKVAEKRNSEPIPVEINEEKEPLEIPETKNETNITSNKTIIETKEEKTNLSEDTIINNIKGIDDNYATYHIHMVSDGESVETICTMYNSSMNILSEYNDLSNIASGDKLIIPDINE